MRVGDLIKDIGDGSLGLVISDPMIYGQLGAKYVEVLWAGQSTPRQVDLKVAESRWSDPAE